MNLPFVSTYAVDGWTALTDPTRRRSSSGSPVSRPAASQHLRVLKEARLVRVRPEGLRRIYAVDPDGLGALRAELEKFWNAALANFKKLAEAGHDETE